MLNLSKKNKIFISLAATGAVLASLPFVLYLEVLPALVSNPKVITYVENIAKKQVGLDLQVKNPVLKTKLASTIDFKVEELSLSRNNESLLNIKNLDTSVSFSKIFQHRVILEKIGLDYVFADVNKLTALAPPQKETKKSEWAIDWFDSLLYVKNCLILYKAAPDTFVKVSGKDLKIAERRNPKHVYFDVSIDVKKGKDTIKFAIKDDDNVYIKNRKLFIDDCVLKINNSKISINAEFDEKNNFDLNVFSQKFDVANLVDLLETNFVIPQASELLAYFKNIKGNFDFKINISNNDIKGNIILNGLSLKVVPLNNLAVSVSKGVVDISKDDIFLHDFIGYYGTNKENKINVSGVIKDYTKSVDANIVANTIMTDEFSQNHLSKVIGYPIDMIGAAKTKVIIKSIYNKIDVIGMFKLAKGDDILIDGVSLSPTGYDRAVKADFHFENNLLNIKSINYYIASEINKQSKIKPVLSINGNVDFSKGVDVQNIGFEIPKPLPSEFLNVLIGQKIFKKGTIEGHLQVINTGKTPVLDGHLAMKKVRIPSQRLSIKEGSLTTDKTHINLNAFGKYRRSEYKIAGNIVNEIIFPIIVKDINLTVDNVDIERMMKSFNNQNAATQTQISPEKIVVSNPVNEEDDDDDNAATFTPGLIIVENCALNLVKGIYKDINFGNLIANLTLDKNGILQVKSNKFDFAEGISSCKVYCDLKKHIYSVKLGVKNINSDLIATTLLGFKKEISGKASGIINLNTDETLRLNGEMKFIVKNGTIGKIGLVEYALKFASLFRNPMAMISPSTIIDLVNIPEGNFDKIVGDIDIKDNIIEKIVIKSSSPQLSSLIVGRFDLENRDATLRIYTKFSSKNKGFAGFMRNISLNSLANRVPLSSRNDSNYYSAELEHLPEIEADEKDCQIFLTKVDGDVEHFNFISSLKKIK